MSVTVGTKIIQAEPWTHPRDGVDGYKVVYADGYTSWSPAKAFEEATGQRIPIEIHPRRAGDVACCYADPSMAKRLLGWEATRGIKTMCEDVWRWQSKNPTGYQ